MIIILLLVIHDFSSSELSFDLIELWMQCLKQCFLSKDKIVLICCF